MTEIETRLALAEATAAAALAAAALLTLTACSSSSDEDTDAKPKATATPSDRAPEKSSIPPRPTGEKRQQLLDALAAAAPDVVRYEDTTAQTIGCYVRKLVFGSEVPTDSSKWDAMLVMPTTGGGGGGRPDIAQSGGPNIEKIDQAISAIVNKLNG